MNRKFDRMEKNICMQNMLLRVHQSLLSKAKNIIRINLTQEWKELEKKTVKEGFWESEKLLNCLLFHLRRLCELTVCGVDALKPRPPGT